MRARLYQALRLRLSRPPSARLRLPCSALRVPSPAFCDCDCEFGSHRQLPTPTAPRNNALFIHTGHPTPPHLPSCVRVDPQISESATGSHGTHVRHTRMRTRIMNEAADEGRRTKPKPTARLHFISGAPTGPHWTRELVLALGRATAMRNGVFGAREGTGTGRSRSRDRPESQNSRTPEHLNT